MRESRSTSTASCRTSSTRSALRAASSSRRASTTSPSTRAATSSAGARSRASTRCARGSTTSSRRRSRILTKTLSSGRPTIVAKVTDAKSGVDPMSHAAVLRADRPDGRPCQRRSSIRRRASRRSRSRARHSRLEPGTQFMQLVASDYQEAKNIGTEAGEPAAEHARPGSPRRGGAHDRPSRG